MASTSTTQLAEALRDRYLLERELGRGGMAIVYLARDLKHDRQVALKVLLPELGAALGPERFLSEIHLAARLQHPHILSVFDSGAAEGHGSGAKTLWFTMPYVEGESLRDRLRRERQLSVDDAVRIAHEAARALDYAHRHEVIHRDIKPENILLTREGDTLVADFGIGRALHSSSADLRLTETGVVLGTPAYMSPEQSAGERELDGRSDVYSLGTVLYEMLVGEPPFTGPTAQVVVARRLTETPRAIRAVRDTVPLNLEQVVLKALARAPADRFATAGGLAEALEAVRRSGLALPSEARPLTARPDSRPRARLQWLGAGLGALALVAVVGGLLRWRASAGPPLDTSVLAVAPFDVLDPKLKLWREGMVDLLSRNLDGAGPLRTVSPTVVVRRWEGRADPESALRLGRRTGAGLALYGSLLSAGPDSVRVRATLFNLAGGKAVEEWEVRDEASRVDRIADSLTFRILQGIGRTRPIGAIRLASFGSTSLPALKAFLQGEQYLRRAEWDSALANYERAIAVDSTFAPALRRASTARGWVRTASDSLSQAYALRAGIHNHGLPLRDSLFIVADSLMASTLEAGPFMVSADSGWGARLHRLFGTLEHATTRYPDDPEAWFLLGEALNHLGPYDGHSYEEGLQAFDRAISLDSAYAPSYIHPYEVSAVYGVDAMRRYLRPFLALAREDANADAGRLIQRLVDSARGNPDRLFEGVSDHALFTAHIALSRLPDSAELEVSLARRIARRPLSGTPLDNETTATRGLARSLMSRGHFREGYRFLLGPDQHTLFADAAIVGAVPSQRAAASFRERLLAPASIELVAAFPWWAAHRDTASLRKAKARADSVAGNGSTPDHRVLGRYAAAAAAAYLALARQDTSRAIEQLLTLRSETCPVCYLDQLTLAQLLVERNRDQEAWQIVRAEHPSATRTPFPTEILWVLLRGRVAERIGERERAIRSYSWVAGMWRNADPELQPYVSEAREGLVRLTGEK